MVLKSVEAPRLEENGSWTIDIVAVHGLDEDHITAWTDPVSKVLWLRDLIPRYIPSARILTYGYDSDVSSASSSGSSERFLQHAQTLVAELDADRLLENTTERPIIFICHGIGGILVKNALAYSSSMVAKDVAHLYGIFVSTYGILFMGTPHDGVEQMSWSVMARNTEGHPSALLEAIAKGSETLQNINDQFAPLVKRFRIHFFWEQQETVTETFARYKVEEKSAAPIWDNTERSGISASHAQMCKFGSVDAPGFSVVRATLRRYALEANDVITPRWRDAKQHIERQRSIEAAEILRHDIRITTKPSDDIRDSAKCNKHFRVPFSASNFFTGRADVAKRLERSMLRSSESAIPQIQKRFILYGLGGSGKTQFCLKFVQDHRQSFWGIFWIDASTVETAEQDFSKLAKIDGFGDTSEDGKLWLTGLEMSWMLIIDNADDPSVDISRFFPSGDRGHILVTSRNSECRYHETVGYQELREMDHEEADTLLLRAAGKDPTSSRLRRLARPITSTLGYLPLALDQAGATIRQNICTLETYLSLYHRQRRQIMSMRSIQGGEAYKYTIYSTWEVSFQMIRKLEKPAAIDACEILQIFAFLHFQQVPTNILQKAWENTSRPRYSVPSRSLLSRFLQAFHFAEAPNHARKPPRILAQDGSSWDTIRFQRALWILRQFSLIVKDVDMDEDRTPTTDHLSWGSYSMHPLVHFWARDRLSKEDQSLWFDITTTVVADSISTNNDGSEHAYRRSLIPHIDCFFGGDHTEPLIGRGTQYRQTEKGIKLAQVYFDGGRFQSARDLQEKVVTERKSILGQEDPDTLQAMTDLGSTYWNIGLMDKAAEIQCSVMEARIEALGHNHPETLKSIDKLADTYWLCGRMAEAQELGTRAMIGLGEVFGPSDVTTLTSTLNLARVYKHRGRFGEAMELQARAQKICMEKLGLEHTLTLRSSMELGVSYCDLGRLDEAETLLQAVVLGLRRILGKEHAYTLWALNDLAKIYCAQDRPVEAEEILVDVLETARRTLGREHIGTRMTMINLARAYSGQRRWLDTEILLNDLQDILMRKIEVREVDRLHPDRLVLMQEQSRNYANQGQVEKAQRLLTELIPMMDEKLGVEHPRTQSARKQLGQLQHHDEMPTASKKEVQKPLLDRPKAPTW